MSSQNKPNFADFFSSLEWITASLVECQVMLLVCIQGTLYEKYITLSTVKCSSQERYKRMREMKFTPPAHANSRTYNSP